MASWFSEISSPRFAAGAISAIYTGVSTDASPMASPPASRPKEKTTTPPASAATKVESANSIAETSSNGLLPMRSPTRLAPAAPSKHPSKSALRSEEHTSELQSRENLVCRLLLEQKKQKSDDQQIKWKYEAVCFKASHKLTD